jgi:hypothetical protein
MRLVIALLLPLMVLRAMLPPGYMPVTANGSLHIAMCSEGLYPAATDQSGGQHTGSGDHKQPSSSGDCPFANAAVNALPPSSWQSVVTVNFDAGAALASLASIHPASIYRVQSARGPPSISL